jgi:uncharacterized protein YbbC (DUF1343 family)/CubicO group peptidase (beta-lactamase class C family)
LCERNHSAGCTCPRLWACILLVVACATLARAQSSPNFVPVDSIIQQAVDAGQIPGAVLVVGHGGAVVHRQAFGFRAVEPRREPMTPDTIFDLASLTKVIATAPAVMRLVERGQVRLNDPVVRYVPEFARNGKGDITVRQLLTHFSGLPDDLDLRQHWHGYAEALQRAYDSPLVAPPGSRFIYSDVNYIVLGELVARVSGMPLDKYVESNIFAPLGMTTTRFLPPPQWIPRIAPTEYDEHGTMMRGVVHDPTARRMGGVAGHAGLFSTADDLALFAQAMLDRKLLAPLTIEKMTTPQQPANATVLRGLGWDIDSPFSSVRGELLPVGSYGHTGFTGTSIWIDPVTDTYIILLSNAVHPHSSSNAIVSLRSRVATAVAVALNLGVTKEEREHMAAITGYNETLAGQRRLLVRNGLIRAGIDVLEARKFQPLLHGRRQLRVGLLTNQTGIDSVGRRTIDVLAHAPGVELQALFSPEHGALGAADTTDIPNSRDPTSGIPIYSVYGATEAQRRPPADVLKQLDALVVDLQDAGAQFYTYETTTSYFLEAAAQHGLEIFILDRPNPITGAFVQGSTSDANRSDFTHYLPIPVRHGLTLGELAQLFNAERNLHAKLTVVPMEGWERGDWYDSTGLLWVNPSPNLRSLTAAVLYPGVALVEGTNVSVGRGTDTPFQLLGAPWIKPRDLAEYLNHRELAGLRFVPVYFTPTSGPYANQRCGGVSLIVTNRNTVDSPELGIELASALRRLYPADYQPARMIEILANQAVFNAILAGEDPRRIAASWQESLEQFETLRQKYLLY